MDRMGKQLVQSIGFMKFDFKSGIHADRKRLEMFLLGGESLGCVCVCLRPCRVGGFLSWALARYCCSGRNASSGAHVLTKSETFPCVEERHVSASWSLQEVWGFVRRRSEALWARCTQGVGSPRAVLAWSSGCGLNKIVRLHKFSKKTFFLLRSCFFWRICWKAQKPSVCLQVTGFPVYQWL